MREYKKTKALAFNGMPHLPMSEMRIGCSYDDKGGFEPVFIGVSAYRTRLMGQARI
jgi:hypothetical protein